MCWELPLTPTGTGCIGMLELVAFVLVAVWLMGLGASSPMAGFINFLLAAGVVVVVVRIIQRRRL